MNSMYPFEHRIEKEICHHYGIKKSDLFSVLQEYGMDYMYKYDYKIAYYSFDEDRLYYMRINCEEI